MRQKQRPMTKLWQRLGVFATWMNLQSPEPLKPWLKLLLKAIAEVIPYFPFKKLEKPAPWAVLAHCEATVLAPSPQVL